jgi:hypothetical protein
MSTWSFPKLGILRQIVEPNVKFHTTNVLFVGMSNHWGALSFLFIGANVTLQLQTFL